MDRFNFIRSLRYARFQVSSGVTRGGHAWAPPGFAQAFEEKKFEIISLCPGTRGKIV